MRIKIERNKPCPCGSGKKYKKCCLGRPEKDLLILEKNIESDLPKKVKEYFSEIEKETQKKIVLKAVSSLSIAGISAGFSLEENNITISIVLALFEDKIELYRSLIHEATHGLLLYGKGYYMLRPRTGIKVIREEIELRNILATMIDDIVVNYMIKQEKLVAFSKKYIPMVKKEIESISQGKDIYAVHLQTGKMFYSKFKIFRYITAWAFIEYFDLEDNTILVLKRYLECFRDEFPKEYEECIEIIGLLNKYNIFSSENHKIVCQKISELWGLDKKMRMVRVV